MFLRRLAQYAFDAVKLPQQLSLLEDRIEEALQRLDASKESVPTVLGPVDKSARVDVGQLVIVDNARADGIVITMPRATRQNRGLACTIVGTSASHPFTVAVDGSSLSEMLWVGSYRYRSTGSAWARGA
jgi:hypothetical protein